MGRHGGCPALLLALLTFRTTALTLAAHLLYFRPTLALATPFAASATAALLWAAPAGTCQDVLAAGASAPLAALFDGLATLQ